MVNGAGLWGDVTPTPALAGGGLGNGALYSADGGLENGGGVGVTNGADRLGDGAPFLTTGDVNEGALLTPCSGVTIGALFWGTD